MTSQDPERTKIDLAPKSRVEAASVQDGSSPYSKKQQRKMMKQRSICSPRRLMNSPPPKQTPPIPCEDLSPSPRRVSMVSSTPLYFIKTNPPAPAPPADQRAVTPCLGMARPVLMKMATTTVTSPTGSRSGGHWGHSFCSQYETFYFSLFELYQTLHPLKFFRPLVYLISSREHKQIQVFKVFKTFAVMFYFVLKRTREKLRNGYFISPNINIESIYFRNSLLAFSWLNSSSQFVLAVEGATDVK